MKMYSILLPLLLTSGSAMYAMHFPVHEDPIFYDSLVIHANGLLKPLPGHIKQAQQQLQDLLAGNSNQAAISTVIDTLVRLYIQELQMNATLAYVDRARQFIRICQKKFDDQQAEAQAVKDQEPLRALTGIESLLPSSGMPPEPVMPEQVAPKQKPVALAQEEEESAEQQSEDEEKSEASGKSEAMGTRLKELYKSKDSTQTALFNTRNKAIQEEALELQEKDKQGTAPVGWRDYIMKKYQDTKDWYFGTSKKESQSDEK